jgi:hypothetical protein
MTSIENIITKTKENLNKIGTNIINWVEKPNAQDILIAQAKKLTEMSKKDNLEDIYSKQKEYNQMKNEFMNRFGEVDELYINLLHSLEFLTKHYLYRRSMTSL